MKVLSGIQPTGRSIGQLLRRKSASTSPSRTTSRPFYFIANLHALNQVRDAAKLRQYTFDIAVDLLALGLDPNKATLFVHPMCLKSASCVGFC